MIGVDEAGRGPWAGPVVAAAVRIASSIEGLNDSKKLTPQKRQQLADAIHASDADVAIGWVSAEQIDTHGLSWAVGEAMRQAVAALTASPFEKIIIDGNFNFLPQYEGAQTQVGADGLVDAVSAASIVAKVARDAYMTKLDSKYPGYAFASHKGYGTAAHAAALDNLGVCPEHRMSFKPVAKFAN